MDIKIGSLNMYKCNYRSDDEIRKDFGKISHLIAHENFDILALQEVLNEGSVARLAFHLGSQWKYVWASPKTNTQSIQQAEGYAYIWNNQRFRLATGQTRESHENDNATTQTRAHRPTIQNNYNELPGARKRLARDPLYARFESIYGWYELRLINTHIMFSASSSEEDISSSDTSLRQKEFETLTDIYRQISDKVYKSCRPSYTILLGDYNLNLKHNLNKSPYVAERFPIEGVRASKCILTIQDMLTTINRNNDGYSNNYDHFSFDEIRFDKGGVKYTYSRIDSVNQYWSGDFAGHKKELSDHVPIVMNISLRGE